MRVVYNICDDEMPIWILVRLRANVVAETYACHGILAAVERVVDFALADVEDIEDDLYE